MTPQELKNSILQRAIEGKLVDQRPEEGSGEELYKLIQEEKNKLIKEGKIKRQKALPEITEDEIPFDIPESWKWVRLGEIIDFKIGKTPPRSELELWKPQIPWVSIADMEDGGLINSTKEGISNDALKSKFSNITSPKGTLLMSFKLTVGKVSILAMEAVHNEAIISIFPIIDIEDMFKSFLFKTLPLVTKFGETKNAIKGKTLNSKSLNNLLFPLPPLAEQKRIVEKIEELMPLVDEYEKNWQKLEDLNKKFPEDMKKSLLQEAIKGKLVEQKPEEGSGEDLYKLIQEEKEKLVKEGKIKKQKALPEITEEEIPFDIPESWKWVRLGEISDFQGGYAFKSSSYVQKSRNQVIRLGNVKQNNLLTDIKSVFISDDLAKEAENYRIKKNDILVTMTGTRRKKDYFFVTLIKESDISEKKLFLNQRVGCFRLNKNTYFEYILRVLQTSLIRDIIFEKETGTANQGNLGSEDIKMYIYIPLPPLGEQKRIVEKLEELLPLCDQIIKSDN